MANGLYGRAPEGWENHDKLLVETQAELLNKVKGANAPGAARTWAEAYALVSGFISTQGAEIKNG